MKTLFPLAVLLAGCPEASRLTSAFQARDAGRTTPALAAAPSDPAHPDPLHDPRERRLKDVRQLTHGVTAASPHFTQEGLAIDFLARAGEQITLQRVSAVKPGPAQPAPAFKSPPGTLWAIVPGFSANCAVAAPPTCPVEAWPDPLALLSCPGLAQATPWSSTKIGGVASCAKQPSNALPCVVSHDGAVACPVTAGPGSYIALTTKADAAPVVVGPRDGIAFAPAFSPPGDRLVFVVKQHETMRLWQAPLDHLELAAAIGPEAKQILDPTFTASKDEVVFASTIDDASGSELDLYLLNLSNTALERVTFTAGIDRFPTLSLPDEMLAWVSERNADPGTVDLFVAHWQRDANQRK